jgi:hypothetical protein
MAFSQLMEALQWRPVRTTHGESEIVGSPARLRSSNIRSRSDGSMAGTRSANVFSKRLGVSSDAVVRLSFSPKLGMTCRKKARVPVRARSLMFERLCCLAI